MPRGGNLPGRHHAGEARAHDKDLGLLGELDVSVAQGNGPGLDVVAKGGAGAGDRRAGSGAGQRDEGPAVHSYVVHNEASSCEGRSGPVRYKQAGAGAPTGQLKALPQAHGRAIRQADETTRKYEVSRVDG